jgi:hypothetical protein
MSGVSCVIFYAGKMLQTIEFPYVALNINLLEGPLHVCFKVAKKNMFLLHS